MKLDVKLNNNTLDQYDKALSTYNEWKSFYRDIKLSTLLEGKRVQFDIDNIQKIGMVHDFITLNNGNKLDTMAFSISGMTFIIKGNEDPAGVSWVQSSSRVLPSDPVLKRILKFPATMSVAERLTVITVVSPLMQFPLAPVPVTGYEPVMIK